MAVETLYSMDGDLSPLKAIVQTVKRVLERGNGHMVVDEVRTLLPGRGERRLTSFSAGTLDWVVWTSRTWRRLRSRTRESD